MKELIARLRNLVIIDEVGSNNPLGKEAADALEAQQAEIEQARRTSQFHKDGLLAANAEIEALRAVLDAAVNLVNVKGRHHSEQAYKRLEETVNAARRK